MQGHKPQTGPSQGGAYLDISSATAPTEDAQQPSAASGPPDEASTPVVEDADIDGEFYFIFITRCNPHSTLVYNPQAAAYALINRE